MTYPNGRKVEFGYHSADGRFKAVKDSGYNVLNVSDNCIRRKRRNMMKALLTCGLILPLFCLSGTLALGLDADWNAPAYSYPDRGTLAVHMLLKDSTAPGTDQSVKYQLINVAGIWGELHYDPAIYCSPRIQAGENVPGVKAVGLLIEPGVYRFSIYTNPHSTLPNVPVLQYSAAVFLFSFDPTKPYGGEFTWVNCKAAIYGVMSSSHAIGDECREKYQADPPTYPEFSLASVIVRNDAKDWCVYE